MAASPPELAVERPTVVKKRHFRTLAHSGPRWSFRPALSAGLDIEVGAGSCRSPLPQLTRRGRATAEHYLRGA
jgi:hypothetical protein